MILRTTPAVRSLLWLIPVVLLWMLVLSISSIGWVYQSELALWIEQIELLFPRLKENG